MYAQFGKRLVDFFASLLLLVMLLPVILLIVVLVRINLGGPVLFRQMRPGINGKPFTMFKFRTMSDARDAQGNLLPDHERLTPFGKFLRSTSLDELPELLNVLRGEMSLIGPRPLLMKYLDYYTDWQMRRHNVVPGITGWAQVNGRNALEWEEKFMLDVWYVDNLSIWVDVKIFFLTFWKVFKRDGITQQGHVTAEEFRGSAGAY